MQIPSSSLCWLRLKKRKGNNLVDEIQAGYERLNLCLSSVVILRMVVAKNGLQDAQNGRPARPQRAKRRGGPSGVR